MTTEEMKKRIDDMRDAADGTLEEPPVTPQIESQAPTVQTVKQYGKYQYSVFLNGSRDEQLVIRTDTFKELLEAKKNVDVILKKVEERKTTPVSPDPDPALQVTCWRCGSTGEIKKGISKKGIAWKAIFCSTGNKSHAQWL